MQRVAALARAAALGCEGPLLGAQSGCWSLISGFAPQNVQRSQVHSSAGPHAVSASGAESKRPLNAFSLFVKEFAQQQPKGQKHEIPFLDRASQAYKALDEQQKQSYKDQADKLKHASQDAAQRAKEEAKAQKAADKGARTAKFMTPYSAYVKANYSSVRAANPDLPTTEIFGKVAETWKKMSDAEKAEFAKTAQGTRAAS